MEIRAAGENQNLEKFLKHCCIGNHDSSVKQIYSSEIPPENFDSFEVIEESDSVYFKSWKT